MRRDDFSNDLVSPKFTRGALSDAERQHILQQFGARVSHVCGKINDGKEATVYLCKGAPGGPPLVAAKMYRARKFRAFRGASRYADTRFIRDRRIAKAIQHRSRKGSVAGQILWVDHEWQMLRRLFEAHVSVPEAFMHSDAGILMEFVGDEQGAAPRLIDIALNVDELTSAWRMLREDIERMLDADVVHGDLSAYNVLWHRGRPRIIDLPQALDVHTPDARAILERDLNNLTRYFERSGIRTSVGDELQRLWPATW